jgi:transglutaminase-like putative cysteine protease
MILRINHTLQYQYSKAVKLLPHSLYLLPKPSPKQQVLSVNFESNLEETRLLACFDAEQNPMYTFSSLEPTDLLTLKHSIEILSPVINPFDFLIYPFENTQIPLKYNPQERQALLPYLAKTEISTLVDRTARNLAAQAAWDTATTLSLINQYIYGQCSYKGRRDGPPQSPDSTLHLGTGSCRDFTVLYIAMARSLGIASRFVSGYCYQEDSSSHALHAWAENYVPGAGWLGYDPTLNQAVNNQYVALASGQFPSNINPVVGAFQGEATSVLSTEITITKEFL